MMWKTSASTLLMLPIVVGFPDRLQAGSETPPPGPPWKRKFVEAHRESLMAGKPLFVYFTKTY